MSGKDNIQQLGDLLTRSAKSAQKVQTHWCKVKSVDWEGKTMDAIGVSDDLEFYDVHLGLGSFYRKPTIDKMCLIGIIENQEAAAFLIDCEAFEEAYYKCQETIFRIKPNGFVVKVGEENLRTLMLDWITAIKSMVFKTNVGPTIELINKPQFIALEPRIKNLLKEN